MLVHTQYLKYYKLMHKIKDTELEKKNPKPITTSLLCCINFKPVNNNCTETLSRSSLILLKFVLKKTTGKAKTMLRKQLSIPTTWLLQHMSPFTGHANPFTDNTIVKATPARSVGYAAAYRLSHHRKSTLLLSFRFYRGNCSPAWKFTAINFRLAGVTTHHSLSRWWCNFWRWKG